MALSGLKPTVHLGRILTPREIRHITSVMFIVAVLGTQPPAEANCPDLVLSGHGTASIDGVLSPGEWDHAGRTDVLVNIPAGGEGGTAQATLFVMNDEANLYLGWRIERRTPFATWLLFEFDNGDDGSAPGVGNSDIEWRFGDPHGDAFDPRSYRGASRGYGHSGLEDLVPGGKAVAGDDGISYFYEISQPLDRLSLDPSGAVGFSFRVRLHPADDHGTPSALVNGDIVIDPAAGSDADGVPDASNDGLAKVEYRHCVGSCKVLGGITTNACARICEQIRVGAISRADCGSFHGNYRAYLVGALACNATLPVAQCTRFVDDGLICPCRVLFNPANTAARSSMRFVKWEFDYLGCNSLWVCPVSSCPIPTDGQCSPVAGIDGLCFTTY